MGNSSDIKTGYIDSEGNGGKIADALPLQNHEDGILIVVDRDKWQMRLYYEGSAETAQLISLVLEAAKDMAAKKWDETIKEEEPKEVN